MERLLKSWSEGNADALSEILNSFYQSDFIPMARKTLRTEKRDITPGELTHLTWERLAGLREPCFESRPAFFGYVKTEMKRALLDKIRKEEAAKRGGGARHVEMSLCQQILDGSGGGQS